MNRVCKGTKTKWFGMDIFAICGEMKTIDSKLNVMPTCHVGCGILKHIMQTFHAFTPNTHCCHWRTATQFPL